MTSAFYLFAAFTDYTHVQLLCEWCARRTKGSVARLKASHNL
jgi:hypothetical protein